MKASRRIVAALALWMMALGIGTAPASAQPATTQKEARDAIHLVGTASKIAGDTVTVSVPDGSATADVVLQPTTTYKVGVKPATRGDLQVGDTVNFVVVRKNPDWLALSVKITHPKKK